MAKFIACDDQVSQDCNVENMSLIPGQSLAVVEKALFRNCLVTMRLKMMKNDLPSSYDVSVYIHNHFVNQLKLLKSEITVSMIMPTIPKYYSQFLQDAPGKILTTSDGWTADNTKGSFLRMTAHWIEVKDKKWKLCSEVVVFQLISDEHSGGDLGRYFVGLCDHMGIMSQNELKVLFITIIGLIR